MPKNLNQQRNSSPSKTPSKDSPWDEPHNSFHCSAEWHFLRMKSNLAGLLHNWGRRLSVGSETFFPSVESIARYFGRNRTTVLRALQELVRTGWAEVVHKEAGKTVAYRLVNHDEWARNHPGQCVQKDTMPWEGEGDILARELYAASGGLAKFLPGQMDGLRKSGLNDQQIAIEFRTFLDRNPQKGRDWKRVYFHFHPYLLAIAEDLRKAGVEKNSRNEGSHRSDGYQSHGSNTPSRMDATGTSRTGATLVFESSSEGVGRGKQTIPTPASQERAIASPTSLKAYGRGFPPSKPSPKTPAPAPRKTQ